MKNKSGLSIVQVLVAMVLLGLLATASIKFMANIAKGQKSVQTSSDFDTLKASINQVLATPELCKIGLLNSIGTVAQFGPSVSNINKFLEIKVGTSSIAKPNQALGGGLTISKLDLIDSGAGGFSSGSDIVYFAQLVIEATKSQGSYGGATLTNSNNPFRLKITTDAASRVIKACDSLGGGGMPLTDQQLCANIGGTWNPLAVAPKTKCTLPAPPAPTTVQISASCPVWASPAACSASCPAGMTIIPGSAHYVPIPYVWASPGFAPSSFMTVVGGNSIKCNYVSARPATGATCYAICIK